MLAPLQMKSTRCATRIRVAVDGVGQQLEQIIGLNVASGSHTQTGRVDLAQPALDRRAVACVVSRTSRADVVATSAEVPTSALLLTTTISSTMQGPRILDDAAMLLRSRKSAIRRQWCARSTSSDRSRCSAAAAMAAAMTVRARAAACAPTRSRRWVRSWRSYSCLSDLEPAASSPSRGRRTRRRHLVDACRRCRSSRWPAG